MNMLTPYIDLSGATTLCKSDIFNLTSDALNMPPPSDLPLYLFDVGPTFPLFDFPETSFSQDGNNPSIWDAPDWVAFDKQPLASLNILSSDTPATSGMDISDPNLLTRSSQIVMPNVPESPPNTASTLVPEDLHPGTVNLVIDTLLKTSSKFVVRMYSTGS
jgi:hypothetical protein